MKSKAIVLACVLTLLTVGAAHGDQYTFTANGQSSGDWAPAINWEPPVTPGSGDEAIIPDGKTCQVTDEQEVEFIDIEDGGRLQIYDSGGRLHLGAAPASALNSTVDGTLQFITASQEPAILVVDQDVVIRGDGVISGDGSFAGAYKLTIDDGIKFLNVDASCAFNNSATVTANGFQMEFSNDVEGDGVFETAVLGELRFNHYERMTMFADFDLDGLRLRIYGHTGSVETSGSLVWTDGDIWINWAGTYFKVGLPDDG